MHKVLSSLVLFVLFVSSLALAADDKLVPVGGVVPSAMGTIHSEQDKNGNVRMKIDVRHLADPTRLVPPRRTYVVWMQREGGAPRPLGELRVGDNQEGTLEATTPAQNFDVFITAENVPGSAPSGPVVMKGHVMRK